MGSLFFFLGVITVVGILCKIFIIKDDNPSYTVNSDPESEYNNDYESPAEGYSRSEFQEETSETQNKIMDSTLNDQHQLMLSTLKEIGCQPTVNEDHSITVTYQGEHFLIFVGDPYAQIWDLGWAIVKGDDPEYPLVMEALNISNFDFGPTAVMTAPDEEGNLHIHSRYGILCRSEIPGFDQYVRSSLDMFFQKKDSVRQHLHKLRLDREAQRNAIDSMGCVPRDNSDIGIN